MPLRKGAVPTTTKPKAAVVAAATRVLLSDRKQAPKQLSRKQEWQIEAWAFYDSLPEVKHALLFIGNALAKLRLFVAIADPETEDGEPIPVSDEASGVPPAVAEAAEAELARLRAELGGQSEIQKELAVNLEAVGECYLVGIAERTDEVRQRDGSTQLVTRPEEWSVRSVSEVVASAGGKVSIKSSPDDRSPYALDPENDTIMRIWQRHPEWSAWPDCALKGSLPECRILLALNQQLHAEVNSRQSAGILLVPNELSFGPAAPTTGEEGADADEDPFLEELDVALTGPIENPESAASVMPLVVRGPAEYLKPDVFRRLTLERGGDSSLDERIKARVERLARGLPLPVEVVMGHQQTTFCVDADTEALTADGWRRHDQIEPGTLVLTIDHGNGVSSWQPVTAVNRFDVVDEPMLLIDRKAHSSLTTAGHRWPVILADTGKRDWRTTGGKVHLNTNHRILTAAPVADLPVEAKWSDDFVELVAWWYTEGHADRRSGLVGVITQSNAANPAHVARIRATLTRLIGGPVDTLRGVSGWAWREYHDPNGPNVRFRLSGDVVRALDVVAPDKAPTVEFVRSLTAAQLELFLRVSVLADGWVVNSGTVMFSQKDPARVDGYELAVILSGRTPSRWSATAATGRYAGTIQHFCSISERTTVRPVHCYDKGQWIAHTGIVWCPTTPNGTWLARRDGHVFYTGNSNAEQVDQDTFEDYLQARCDMLVDALTVGFLRPQLEENPAVGPEWAQRLMVWRDASALVGQPNVEANADSGFDRFAISWAAWRKAKGYSEDDAPEPLEMLIRAGLRRGILTADITKALLDLLGIEIDVPEQPADDEAAALPEDGDADAAVLMQQLLALAAHGGLGDSAGGNGRAARRHLSREWEALDRRPLPPAPRALTAALPTGARLAAADRELRTRLLVAANDAMTRALERAGNRLRSKPGPTRRLLEGVPALSAAATLGPTLTAQAVGDPAELLDGAWDELERQFLSWGTQVQQEALESALQLAGGFSSARRQELQLRQAGDLEQAWQWMRQALTTLAVARMFEPDPAAPDLGEFDPSLRVPSGLVRQAISRAGGATGLLTEAGGAWIALTDSGTRPAGGIGTGELLRGVFRDAGVALEAYRWVYGPGFRQRPFDPHLELDGVVFRNFDDDVLANRDSFPPFPFYLPGDHSGCQCDFEPIILEPEEEA